MQDKPARRRWPWITAVILVVVLAVAWGSTVAVQPPPRFGSAFGVEGAKTVRAPDADPDEERQLELLTYRHGETTDYLFAIRNPGPLPVTITEIDLRTIYEGDSFLLVPIEARLGRPGDIFPASTVAFEPFRLGADEERTVVVTLRFENCEERWIDDQDEESRSFETVAETSTQFFGTEKIRYRILAWPRSTEIELPSEIGVETPSREDCPPAS